MNGLIGELSTLQSEMIKIVSSLSEDEFCKQYHPDLSPVGWHLGHCIYTESYWIREQLLEHEPLDEKLHSLYVPEMSNKDKRGKALPEKKKLINWAQYMQQENKELLGNKVNSSTSHHLLDDDFLFHFLIQHYAQHLETIKMVQTGIRLSKKNIPNESIIFLEPQKPQQNTVTIHAEYYQIGSKNKHNPYDNEHPVHKVKLDSFNISVSPVSNAEFLTFIDNAGYSRKELWSDAGWKWLSSNKITHPYHWRFEKGWYGINHEGVFTLAPEQPIYGLSYFEANAYAKWARARLPHEYEWETACQKNYLEKTFLVWEWCNNTFHPYPGFTAYPYEGYSSPYFDNNHYVLKGGSCYTKAAIKRSSFRNYYTADKRHIFAGMRLINL